MTRYSQQVVQLGHLAFWTETFGDKAHPAVILIMGSGGQGVLWPQLFCEELANKGYFVMRYDHRDTGLSASLDYEKTPYNLLDMATDIIGLMDAYDLKGAHLVGASMGGAVALLAGAHFPDRVLSLTLMMTTYDMRPAMFSFQGLPTDSLLSKPSDTVLNMSKDIVAPPETLEEKVNLFINYARINSGGKVPVDEALCRQLALLNYARMKNEQGAMNHFHAINASHDLLAAAPAKVQAPTLIIHGDVDPVFPIDHAHAMQEAISHAQLSIIDGLGHGLFSPVFFNALIDEIDAAII